MNLSSEEVAQIIGQLVMENHALRKRVAELEAEKTDARN